MHINLNKPKLKKYTNLNLNQPRVTSSFPDT